jgi:hypothetical protein
MNDLEVFGLFGLFMGGAIALIGFVLLLPDIIRIINLKKKTCTGCYSCFTRDRDENGKPLCLDCRLKKTLACERMCTCPADGHNLRKLKVLGGLIVEECPRCKSIFLEFAKKANML